MKRKDFFTEIVELSDFDKYVNQDLSPILDIHGNVLYEIEVLNKLPPEPQKLLRKLFYGAIKYAKANEL